MRCRGSPLIRLKQESESFFFSRVLEKGHPDPCFGKVNLTPFGWDYPVRLRISAAAE